MNRSAAGPSTRPGSSSSSSPSRIRLVTWAVSTARPASRLPCLDPDGLYALSLLQARRGAQVAMGDVEIEVQAPSTLLHSTLPCLEDATTSVVLADSIDSIDRFSGKLAGRKGERDLLTTFAPLDMTDAATQASEDSQRWASSKALERYVLANLHPLVYQTLFAKELFHTHTVRQYQSGLSSVAAYGMPHRLRRHLQTSYAQRGCWIDPDSGLGPILMQGNDAQALAQEDHQDRRDLAKRAGTGSAVGTTMAEAKERITTTTSLLRESQQEAGRAFGQLRIVSFADEVLSVLSAALGSSQYFFATQSTAEPSTLDLRVFSLLAPLLLPTDAFPALAASPVVQRLRQSFPQLVHHTQRVQNLLWSVVERQDGQGRRYLDTPDWPILPGWDRLPNQPEGPLSIRIATQLGRSTSHMVTLGRRMASHVSNTLSAPESSTQESATEAADGTKKKATPTPQEQREARMVRWGKYIWIVSAVVGVIGTAFASGLLAIEFVDEEQGLDGEDEEMPVVEAKEEEELMEDIAEELDDDDEIGDMDDEDDEDEMDEDDEEEYGFDEEEE